MRKRELGFLLMVGLVLTSATAFCSEHVASVHLGSRYEHAVERDGFWYLVSQWGLECWEYTEAGAFVKLSEAPTPGIASWVAVEGDYAYVADEFEGLSIVDISDPYDLRFVSNFMPWPVTYDGRPGRFYYVAVKNGYVYLSGRYGVAVIDATDPYNPEQVDRLYFADTLENNEIWDYNEASDLIIIGDFLYAAFSILPSERWLPEDIFRYDISDPYEIEFVSRHFTPATWDGIFAVQDSLLILAGRSELAVFSIAQDGALAVRDYLSESLWHYSRPVGIAVIGDQVLVAGSGGQESGGITRVDISDPDSIFYAQDYWFPINFGMLCFADSVGIAGYFHNGILQLGFNANGHLDSTGFVGSESGIFDLAIFGDYLYAADWHADLLRVFDISNRVQPTEQPALEIEEAARVEVFDNKLFVGTGAAEIQVYDLSDPANLSLLDRRQIAGSSAVYYDFVLWNGLLFAGRQDYVLELYDFSAQTFHLVSQQTIYGVGELQIRDSVLFTGHDILKINPDTTLTQLSETGVFEYVFSAFDLLDTIFLAASGYNGLGIFDISDLAVPRFVTYWDTLNSADPPGDGVDVVYLEEHAFLLDGSWGITVLDVSDPEHPFFVERIPTPASARTLVLDDDYFYVADMWGIEIFRYQSSVHVTDVVEPLPQALSLYQNHPNPFNATTLISYVLDRPTEVSLDIYNVLGQHVRTLQQGRQLAGEHQVVWDGKSQQGAEVASGVYLGRLQSAESAFVKKMLLLR
ncbi:MAG: FlgD immunoglobulin-like domain containing protein [bacterium]